MIRDQPVDLAYLTVLFQEIEPQLIRCPAVDAASLKERVLEIGRRRVQRLAAMNFDGLPAVELLQQGLADLAHRRDSVAACLVKIASPRLRRCGKTVDLTDDEALAAGYDLYALPGNEYGREAHSRYNALRRELVSFERALEARRRRGRMA